MIQFRIVFLLLFALLALPAAAQDFPKLTGRIVDTAGFLQPDQAALLDAKLAAIEQTTGHQVVVATIPSLNDVPIEDYGYKLGRAWGIGGKGANDGVILLLVKNKEGSGGRRIRIEVGYGLEPLLTDAFTSVVINTLIVPRFRANDYAGGIDAAINAIGAQIKLTPDEAAKRTAALAAAEKKRDTGVNPSAFIFWIIIILFFIVPIVRGMAGGRRYRGGGGVAGAVGDVILWSALNSLNSRGGGWSSGGGSDWGGGGGGGSDWGGGGGGSFGGGGASGDW